MMAQGQALSQTTYSTLFNQVGITPSFTPDTKTILPYQLVDIAYNGSIYVATGSNLIYISTDGVNWNLSPAFGQGPFSTAPTAISYCSGLGIFVIVNTTTIAYTSTDGINWVTSLIAADANVSYVACSPTTIVVGGSSDTDNSIENVWTSTDGVNWTKTPIAGTGGVTITALYYSAGFGTGTAQFLLGTSSGAIQTSPTGSTWTARTSNIANQINQIVLGNLGTAGTIVAVGNGGVITTSLDNGATWTAHTYQTGANLNGIAYNSSLFVASGSSIIMTSADGQTWTTSTSTISGKSSITYGSTYVEAGANAMLATSSNLNTWTGQTSAFPLITMNAAAFGNSAYVVGGNSGDIQSSANATTWNSRTSNYGANNIAHIIYAAGTINLFVACGSNTTQVVTSPDGTTWTAQTSNIGAVATTALAFNGTTLVLVGASGKIATSTNGTAWTSRTSNTTTSLNGVAWNGTIFCAVGNSGVIVTSPDGITWTKQSPTGLLNTSTDSWITSDGTSFYMHQGGNVVFVSTNGITWTGYAAPFTLLGLNWINSQLIAYSANNDIAYSTNGQQWTLSTGGRGVTTWNKAYYYSTLFLTQNVANSGGITTSTDGVSFAGQYSSIINAITYSASQTKLVAVGNQGQIMSSTNSSSTWTQNISMAGVSVVTFNAIAYSSSLNLFIALTSNGGIYSSSNGTTWTQRIYSNQFMSLSFAFNNVIWEPVNGIFVAVGSFGVIATSPDGITWTNRTTNCFSSLTQVCYNTSLGLFVSVSAGSSTSILTSTNGITWSIIPSANIGGGAFQTAFRSVASLEANGFVAIVDGNIMYRSADGITWIQVYTLGDFRQSVANFAKLFTSNVDSGAFFTQGGAAYTNTQTFTVTDGFTVNVVTPLYYASGGFWAHAITYDSVNDVYIVVGSVALVARLTRTYNKATQFVLPVLYQTAVKVL